MDSKVLTGNEAREVLASEKTRGKCGYYEGYTGWTAWDHRGLAKRGIHLDSEEAVKKWLL